MSEMLDKAILIARAAGDIVLGYSDKVKVNYKDENFDVVSVITEADLKSEEFIVSNLQKYFPGAGLVSEEGARIKKQTEYEWYVDPLDGTSNFSRNIPLFGISIGLLKDNKPFLGVLHFPALNKTVYAEAGQGAFMDNKPIKVSGRTLAESLYWSGGLYKRKMDLVPQLTQKVGMVKIIDASSYELAQIAMGDAELYVLDNSPHDVVAGIAIVQEAGGRVSDYEGNDWKLDSDKIVVSNGLIHNEVLKLLSE